MKAHLIEEKQFTPVCLVLETQEEVDALYTILGLGPIQDECKIARAAWLALQPHRTTLGSNVVYDKLSTLLK